MSLFHICNMPDVEPPVQEEDQVGLSTDLRRDILEMKRLLQRDPVQHRGEPPDAQADKHKPFGWRQKLLLVFIIVFALLCVLFGLVIWFGLRISALKELQAKNSEGLRALEKLQAKNSEDFTAFTADHPAQSTTEPTRLAFGNIRYQRGSGYNRFTGTFHCTTPGIYSFSASIVKKKDATTMTCHIYKNNDQLANLILDGTNYTGNTAVSATVNTDLTSGDNVYLADCSSATTMEKWSVFSGFLLNRQ